MDFKGAFLSLRWKLAVVFGSVFLILHSVFSYVSYLHAIDHFDQGRKALKDSHVNVINALTEDSFLVLEQFAELLVSLDEFSSAKSNLPVQAVSVLDGQWSKWQLTWGVESIALFNKDAMPVKSWGNKLKVEKAGVEAVLENEQPVHRLFCLERCYQRVLVPVIGHTHVKGVFTVVSLFDDVIIKYKHATNADIGLLAEKPANQQTPKHTWPYALMAMTAPEKNIKVFDYVSQHFSIEELSRQSKTVKMSDAIFEVGIAPANKKSDSNQPLFLFVDDVSADYANLNKGLKEVWLFGVLSLLGSLILLITGLHFSLRRVVKLAQAMPLLAGHHYDQFREQFSVPETAFAGYDELDQLNQSALTLSNQLENMELEMRRNTFMLLEKSQDLAKERDFVQQLLEAAPIIIITQSIHGIILSINKTGAEAFGMDSQAIVGQVFDGFLPERDHEHLIKLGQLRQGDFVQRVQVDGFLVASTEYSPYISWLHTFLKSTASGSEVILTLGMDISARRIAEESMLKMTSFDYLTGLTNRRKFHEEFAFELAMAKRYGYQIALFYVDLDQFKAINDEGGQEAGDQLLLLVAGKLKQALRSTDLLSRVGGDEFAVIMPHIEFAAIDGIAQKLAQVLNGLGFSFAGKAYQVTISIGIAVFPLHGATINELLANADMAMYESKASGLGQYHIFSEQCDYQLKLGWMLHWRKVIEDAIAYDRFVLVYQPILSIATNTINHYECLLRLKQDDGELVAPVDFVGYAEELGLVGKIDRIVLAKAVQKLAQFKHQGKPYSLSINLSGHSFNDTTIFEDISRLLSSPDIEPSKIIFEITETAAVSNFAAAEILIAQIKALGCSLALDDFGVGFSSFYYLKQFPVDYVKIDGSFIRQLEKSDDDRVFVKSLSSVAQAFGKRTVAEFVENAAVLEILKEFGVDYAQGYFIGKPVSLD